MNGKQFGIVALAVVVIVATVGTGALMTSSGGDSGKLRVVASFYPLAYMAEAIGGERVEVITLIPYNTEVHSWQPSASDILQADSADILIYNGADLEPWMEKDLLPSIDTRSKLVVETAGGIGTIEGEDEPEVHSSDPHTWISPSMAVQQAESIYKALVEADPDNSSYFAEGWSDLESTLHGLDDEYEERLAARQWNTIFVSHAAYGYIADRYGLIQEGIIGVSANEQPSSATIAILTDMMVDEGIYTIFLNPIFTDEYVLTLKQEVELQTGGSVTVLELYIMTGPVGGMDYIDQMEMNLENLCGGLGA